MNFSELVSLKDEAFTLYGNLARMRVTPKMYYSFDDPNHRKTVEMIFSVPQKFETSVYVDLIDHTVYVVEHFNDALGKTLRCVHPGYVKEFAAEHFDLMRDPTKDSRGLPIEETDEEEVMNAIFRDLYVPTSLLMDEDEDEEDDDGDYETISLDLTDSELALIARAAHVKDVTINEFINEAVKIKLDEWEKNCLNYDQNVL